MFREGYLHQMFSADTNPLAPQQALQTEVLAAKNHDLSEGSLSSNIL